MAQDNICRIDFEMVKDELLLDSLSERIVNINGDYDYKFFYIDDVCIVHIHQYCGGVMDAAIQRFYKYENGKWIFIREASSLFYECEQLSEYLFHAYLYKSSPIYEAYRFEAILKYDNFDLVPLFEYEGINTSFYLLNKYYNGQFDYFNKYIGDTICNDYEVFDVEVYGDTLKSYKLKHTIRILEGFNEELSDLRTHDIVTEDVIITK